MAVVSQAADEVLARAFPQERTELLRFVTMGSVDDGKSTLIGRLLHDTHGVYDDQLRAVKQASAMEGAEIDFSLFTDGLVAEREQGITIDVAYRYFATSKRKFILADTPGHVQYTRNMATGASTASVAIILIDARLGVLQQSRRHAYIASLLGIPHLVVCVNKLDLLGYDEATYRRVCDDFRGFASQLRFADVTFLPVSALRGDNVVQRSARTPYHDGPTLLEYLESVPIDDDLDTRPFRYPVQTVLRPSLDYRGYAGQIASGIVRPGDEVVVLPSRRTTRVVGVDGSGAPLEEAFAPMSVALRLADEIDISRGDMIVHASDVPRVEQRFDAMMVWLQERPLDRARSYFLKHTTRMVRAAVEAIAYRLNLDTLENVPASELVMNDIARVTVHAQRPLFVDAYARNRVTGAFILVDALTNDTVAAGMILEAREEDGEGARSEELSSLVSQSERRDRVGHTGAAIVIEAGGRGEETSAAYALERILFDRGYLTAVVTGEGAESAAVACVGAGVLAVCVTSRLVGAGLRERLGSERVVFVGAGSAEEMAAEAGRRLAERGVSLPHSL
jgi:bifunctional enzyme CysN/CysC/sulfate adenylyltransferase subunit 1